MESYSSDRKKISTLYILEILKRYTDDTIDENGHPAHCLTQAQIGEKLYKDYDIILDRKAIARGLDDLIYSKEYADKIQYEIKYRSTTENGKKAQSEYKTDFRYVHDFDSAQISALINAVLFFKSLTESECKELVEKINTLGGTQQEQRRRLTRHLYNLSAVSEDKVVNEQMLANIDLIDEAIENGKQIIYNLNNYGKDKKLKPKLVDGLPVFRVVNPYRMVANNGRYYLVCNYDEYDDIRRVRIDKITNLIILDSAAKPKSKVKGLDDSAATEAEQLYMQPGKPERVVFKVPDSEEAVSNVVDWFGKSVKFTDDEAGSVICEVKTNPEAMRFWAMQYSDSVEVLEPESLRERIENSLLRSWRKYSGRRGAPVESDEKILDLISEWEQVKSDALEDRLDIRILGDVVRRTHFILLLSPGKYTGGVYSELVHRLEGFSTELWVTGQPDARAAALIIRSLTDEYHEPDRRKGLNIPEDIILITPFSGDGSYSFRNAEINLNRFEDDYLTLLHLVELEMQCEKDKKPYDYHSEESIRYFLEQRAKKKKRKMKYMKNT